MAIIFVCKQRATVQEIMPRDKGQTSQQRADQENDKDTTIHRLAELVERQAQQIERLIERDQRREEQLPVQVVARQENHEPASERFRKNKPPVFKGETDPLLAEEWIRSSEGIFDYVPNGCKVLVGFHEVSH